ncbi:unnamed protein product [Hymenolepis diminuta]|uniref:Ras-associating domain-containing protein n=1 Tax=Hymenolepis diminuta TaxID=6216 RepID=A0A0R3SKA7_HYMDI|nr:unnamed protein product [Hymenolepis diminuta]
MLKLQRSDSSTTTGGKSSSEEGSLSSRSSRGRRNRRVTYTFEDQQLREGGKPVKATIYCSEMNTEMENWAVDCAAIALLNKASIKHIAAYIKKEFDKNYVSHFEGSFIYFILKDYTVLLFQI